MTVTIPQANPRANYEAYREEIDAAVRRALESGRYIHGPEVEAFEREFATFLGVPHAVAVASGTEALWLALRALNVGPGDDVIAVSLTAVATVAAIVETGARPVMVDVCADDLTLDPARFAAAISPRTKVVIPVHLYGQAARLKEICAIAEKAGLAVLEDCAQAHGAACEGRAVGSWGRLGAFSFYPTKNLGAIGDGGAVVTSDPSLAERLRLLREYGWRERYVSAIHGWNSRLDELQAAILRVKLLHLTADNRRRTGIAAEYTRALAGTRIAAPPTFADRTTVYHQYVVRHPQRDPLRELLAARGIGTAIHYPVPIHLQDAYRHFGAGPGSLPVTERATAELISLPIYPELSEREVKEVCEACQSAVAQLAGRPEN
ncbi:MAG: DegT/DnrJ/EryC1/StrS family aminotransferase [Chloroflexi bacterium]|nr:DegT/DnrJ/EryC1/StrS family aminotransferase [Chloroflexota bacterium]